MSRVIIALQRMGIAFFSFQVLTVPGRRTGRMRDTVVSPYEVDGHRYVLSFGQLNWVRNARNAGWGYLRRGRRRSRVSLTEVRAPESRKIAGGFPVSIPGGVRFFVRLGLVEAPGRPDQFKAAADRLVVFRIVPSADA
jgi:hypothetical protein